MILASFLMFFVRFANFNVLSDSDMDSKAGLMVAVVGVIPNREIDGERNGKRNDLYGFKGEVLVMRF